MFCTSRCRRCLSLSNASRRAHGFRIRSSYSDCTPCVRRPLVDYRGVADIKLEILALLYQDFRDQHLAMRSGRGREFLEFVARRGPPLQLHARFDALDRYFRATLGTASGWMSWPQEYRDVNGAAATRFALEHPAEVEFYAYLQWLAHEQLLQAQALTRSLGMPIGLYGDYAVGANPSGSETWVDQASYCLGAEIGAPPILWPSRARAGEFLRLIR